MHNKILTAAKRLKTFTFDDIVMMTELEESTMKSALNALIANNKIKHAGNGEFWNNLQHFVKITLERINKVHKKLFSSGLESILSKDLASQF